LPFQDPSPVELDGWVRLFDEADGVLIEGGAADSDPGRCPEPVEDPRTQPPAPSFAVNHERILVPVFVAAEAKVRQSYFLF
jgi:hypothetical protein